MKTRQWLANSRLRAILLAGACVLVLGALPVFAAAGLPALLPDQGQQGQVDEQAGNTDAQVGNVDEQVGNVDEGQVGNVDEGQVGNVDQGQQGDVNDQAGDTSASPQVKVTKHATSHGQQGNGGNGGNGDNGQSGN